MHDSVDKKNIRNLVFRHFANIANDNKNKKETALCPETQLAAEKVVLELATTDYEIKKLKNVRNQEITKADQILDQCLPKYREDKNKIIARKVKLNEYYQKRKHEWYGEKELNRRTTEFVPLRKDHYEEDKKNAMDYSSFTSGVRKFYWPNNKKIKKLNDVEISQDHFTRLSYPTTNANDGTTEWIYDFDKINTCYPAILRYAKKKLDDIKIEAEKKSQFEPGIFDDTPLPGSKQESQQEYWTTTESPQSFLYQQQSLPKPSIFAGNLFTQKEMEHEQILRSQMEPIYNQKLQENPFQKDELVQQFNAELQARMNEWRRNFKGKKRIDNESIPINLNQPVEKVPRIEQDSSQLQSQAFVPGPSRASVMGIHHHKSAILQDNVNPNNPFSNEQEENIAMNDNNNNNNNVIPLQQSCSSSVSSSVQTIQSDFGGDYNRLNAFVHTLENEYKKEKEERQKLEQIVKELQQDLKSKNSRNEREESISSRWSRVASNHNNDYHSDDHDERQSVSSSMNTVKRRGRPRSAERLGKDKNNKENRPIQQFFSREKT